MTYVIVDASGRHVGTRRNLGNARRLATACGGWAGTRGALAVWRTLRVTTVAASGAAQAMAIMGQAVSVMSKAAAMANHTITTAERITSALASVPGRAS